MNSIEKYNSFPVWRCPGKYCHNFQWASIEEDLVCPYCHINKGVNTGFKYGELKENEISTVHLPNPVPELVQLSTIQPEYWIGLPVFHPCSQTGTECNWLLFDLGVITDFYPDPDIEDEVQCKFITGAEGALHYSPHNLWVPSSLAKNLNSK